MGTSAGAMIQLDYYHLTPEEDGQDYQYEQGLGLLSGFDIEVHYEPSFLQLASIVTDLKLHQKPIFALPNEGGMIVDGKEYTLLGGAFMIRPEDVEDIQDTINWIIEETEFDKFDRIF